MRPPRVAVDGTGRVYVADGNRRGELVDLGDGIIPPEEISHVWVVAYAPNGRFLWRRHFGPADAPATVFVRDVAAGPSCVAIVGSFESGSVDFGLGPHVPVGEDSFVVCLDPATGATLWDEHISGGGSNRALETVVHPSGDVTVAGRFGSGAEMVTVTIGDTTHSTNAAGDVTTYLAAFESTGDVLWSRAIDALAVKIEGVRESDVVVVLDTDRPVDPGGGIVGPRPPRDERQAVVVAYGPAGEFRWQVPFEAGSFSGISAIGTAADGQILVAGGFGTDLRAGGLEAPTAEPISGFIGRLGPDGLVLDLRLAPAGIVPHGIALQAGATSFIGGSFRGEIDFGSGCRLTVGSRPDGEPAGPDGFLVALDPAGRCQWFLHLASYAFTPPVGYRSNEYVSDVVVDHEGSPIFVGSFNGMVEIADATITGEVTGIYVAKLTID